MNLLIRYEYETFIDVPDEMITDEFKENINNLDFSSIEKLDSHDLDILITRVYLQPEDDDEIELYPELDNYNN